MAVAAIAPGFADPVFDAQKAFRTVMDAMAHPGRIYELQTALAPPAPLSPVAAAVLLTLADFETTLWLGETLTKKPAVADWLRFHTGTVLTGDPGEATFAAIADPDRLPPLGAFAQGTLDYPDRSTTLILQVGEPRPGTPARRFPAPASTGRLASCRRRCPTPSGWRPGATPISSRAASMSSLPRRERSPRCPGPPASPRKAEPMYVAVKGGEKAIANAHRLLADKRRGERSVPAMTVEQIVEQLALAVDRVMAEGSLYDKELAALAIKQARGDLIEAIFLVRAFRTTLPRFGHSEPLETDEMHIRRRISATFKDLPGGQLLGPTFDYTHRLIDFALAAEGETPEPVSTEPRGDAAPRVTDLLNAEGLLEVDEDGDGPVGDLTREPIDFPAGRDVRLQALARGDEGFLLALGYSTQRGYARTHPFAGEIRMGEVEVELYVEELGFAVTLGRLTVTECQMITQFTGSAKVPPQFSRGYGLTFGHSERKSMAMALVDRALRFEEFGEELTAPAQDQEFVLSHSDNVQATGFTEHLKLPHYVDFQAELDLIRRMRREIAERAEKGATDDTHTEEAAE